MPVRTRIVSIVVISAMAVLVTASGAGASTGGVGARDARGAIVAQKGPWDFFRALVKVTKQAVVTGRRILTSDEAKTARKIGNRIRTGTNFYCGQWVGYFKAYPYRARTTKTAVLLWRWSYRGHPSLPAGRAYGLCKSLYYLPIVIYG